MSVLNIPEFTPELVEDRIKKGIIIFKINPDIHEACIKFPGNALSSVFFLKKEEDFSLSLDALLEKYSLKDLSEMVWDTIANAHMPLEGAKALAEYLIKNDKNFFKCPFCGANLDACPCDNNGILIKHEDVPLYKITHEAISLKNTPCPIYNGLDKPIGIQTYHSVIEAINSVVVRY